MVNSGSIVVNALLQNVMKPDMSGAEKFDYLNDYIKVIITDYFPESDKHAVLVYESGTEQIGKFENRLSQTWETKFFAISTVQLIGYVMRHNTLSNSFPCARRGILTVHCFNSSIMLNILANGKNVD